MNKKEVKLIVDGHEVKLTEKQIKILFSEEKKSPFNRTTNNEQFYYINETGLVCIDYIGSQSYNLHHVANYCTDKKLMQQRALHEILNRLLWRFSCENGELENEWDGKKPHYSIVYDYYKDKFDYVISRYLKPDDVYFPSKEIAERAIEKIVKPFMKENPSFIW